MSHIRPVAFRWDAEAFAMIPTQRYAIVARRQYANGGEYLLEVKDEASYQSRKAYFAQLREIHDNLPDHLLAEYGTVEKMRKTALIETNFCKTFDAAFSSPKEAQKMAAGLSAVLEEYSRVAVIDNCVRVQTPLSQDNDHMDADTFEKSKRMVLDWCSALIGTTRGEVSRNAGKSA